MAYVSFDQLYIFAEALPSLHIKYHIKRAQQQLQKMKIKRDKKRVEHVIKREGEMNKNRETICLSKNPNFLQWKKIFKNHAAHAAFSACHTASFIAATAAAVVAHSNEKSKHAPTSNHVGCLR